MTRLYRLAVVIAAGAFVSLLVVDTASDVQAAKRKKHGPAPASASSTAADPKAATSGPTGGAAEADPVKNPPSAKKPADPGKAETEAAKKPPDKWSDTEIADAKAHCAVVLKRIHAVAIQHEPIKEGACGAPAPIELVSIGQNPEVALSPPAIVRCDLAEALVTWLEGDLQPLARKYFKSPIIRMETMSLVLLPQRLWAQEDEAQRARPRQCSRYWRLHYGLGANGGCSGRLGHAAT